MSEIFLSASVPVAGRGRYFETADPFLIQLAVRELLLATIATHTIVWGGHPAITPMVWSVCEDLGVDYAKAVVLYQSAYFADAFPEENARFRNTIVVPAVEGDRQASLERMRTAMLSRKALSAAVFIGGMDGVEEEFQMFQEWHPNATVLAVGAPGGAARDLSLGQIRGAALSRSSVDFVRIYREELLPVLG